MEMWIPLIYPILIGGLAVYFFRHRVLWWEAVIPMGVVVLFIALYRFGVETAMTRDTEYWGGVVEKVEYYEDWDEWIQQTCECCCDEDGENCSEYDCSYVDYHPAQYYVTDNNGITQSCDEATYHRLVKQFWSKPVFTDMYRNYDSNDGDLWTCYWQGEKEKFEPMYTEHSYENRVQVSSNVYNYPEVSDEDKKKYGLYDYPKIIERNQVSILGDGGINRKKAEKEFTWLNSSLGKKKQLRTWVLLFNGKPRNTGQMQERYWKGGNKNEFIICIGFADKNSTSADWCHTFSWSESQEPKITIRDYVTEQDTLDLVSLADFTYSELNEKYERRAFSEFSYLDVEPPLKAIIWCHIIAFLLSAGITFWSMNNEVDANSNVGANFFNKGGAYHKERKNLLRRRMNEMNRRRW